MRQKTQHRWKTHSCKFHWYWLHSDIRRGGRYTLGRTRTCRGIRMLLRMVRRIYCRILCSIRTCPKPVGLRDKTLAPASHFRIFRCRIHRTLVVAPSSLPVEVAVQDIRRPDIWRQSPSCGHYVKINAETGFIRQCGKVSLHASLYAHGHSFSPMVSNTRTRAHARVDQHVIRFVARTHTFLTWPTSQKKSWSMIKKKLLFLNLSVRLQSSTVTIDQRCSFSVMSGTEPGQFERSNTKSDAAQPRPKKPRTTGNFEFRKSARLC